MLKYSGVREGGREGGRVVAPLCVPSPHILIQFSRAAYQKKCGYNRAEGGREGAGLGGFLSKKRTRQI